MRKSSSHSNVPAMEQLFSSAAVDDDEENLALLPHFDDEHTLDLGIHQPNLCTAARRFRGPSPSPTPERPPERRRTTGIAAGNGSAPKSPFSPLFTVAGEGRVERNKHFISLSVFERFISLTCSVMFKNQALIRRYVVPSITLSRL